MSSAKIIPIISICSFSICQAMDNSELLNGVLHLIAYREGEADTPAEALLETLPAIRTHLETLEKLCRTMPDASFEQLLYVKAASGTRLSTTDELLTADEELSQRDLVHLLKVKEAEAEILRHERDAWKKCAEEASHANLREESDHLFRHDAEGAYLKKRHQRLVPAPTQENSSPAEDTHLVEHELGFMTPVKQGE